MSTCGSYRHTCRNKYNDRMCQRAEAIAIPVEISIMLGCVNVRKLNLSKVTSNILKEIHRFFILSLEVGEKVHRWENKVVVFVLNMIMTLIWWLLVHTRHRRTVGRWERNGWNGYCVFLSIVILLKLYPSAI